MTPGTTYTAEIKVVKVKKGAASAIVVDGKRYVLDMANK